ncbi:MAG: PHP domain-containing protein [Clostridiales bacterium]|nr:PHP domain-containing protein [Clostridiales bacterium]
MQELIKKLNGGTAETRLEALKELVQKQTEKPVRRDNDANNHIHTIYSFSPYSPTKAAYMAYMAGLTSAGIMDHDSLSGVEEFKKACEILGLGSTCGVEVRAKFNRGFGKMNHPDQAECVYMAAHGIPAQSVQKLNDYLAFYREKRNQRNAEMCKLITGKFGKFGVELDFEKDVKPLSQAELGGSVTERHLLYALAVKLENKFGRTNELIAFLENDLNLKVNDKIKGYLLDSENENFLYDLLGVLKADTAFFYIDADEEMPDAVEFVKFAKSLGAIPAYAYLGDVGNSVTGDKKAQKFEDDFLPELIAEIKKAGYLAVAYMPTRNTPEQLVRISNLCQENGFFEISGEDVNSPRQKFACAALAKPEHAHLIDATWALIGHEAISSEKGLDYGMFSEKTIKETPNLYERIKKFAIIGHNTVK